MMDITPQDQKILSYLYHSKRESIAQVAKKLKLTRIQVEYKMKKFEREGVIKKYLGFFDYAKLGYPIYISAYFKLEKYSAINKFTKVLDKSKHCVSWGECYGTYDIFANLVFEDEVQVQEFLSQNIYNKELVIENYLLNKPYYTEFYPLKVFNKKTKEVFPINSSKENKPYTFQNHELEILKLLEKNSRTKIVEIAHALGISAELVLHKIRKLQKEKIFYGTKVQLNMKKLGFNYSVLFLKIRQFDEITKEKIVKFCQSNDLINALLLSITYPNCFIQIFHRSEDELKEVISKLKFMLKNQSVSIDVAHLKEEEKINMLPMFTKRDLHK